MIPKNFGACEICYFIPWYYNSCLRSADPLLILSFTRRPPRWSPIPSIPYEHGIIIFASLWEYALLSPKNPRLRRAKPHFYRGFISDQKCCGRDRIPFLFTRLKPLSFKKKSNNYDNFIIIIIIINLFWIGLYKFTLSQPKVATIYTDFYNHIK